MSGPQLSEANLDLAANPQAVRAIKLPISVEVSFADTDGCCETREGPVAYLAGDAILRGVESETWPVPRGRFMAMYDPVSASHQGEPGQYVRRPATILALQLDRPTKVRVGWRSDPIQGGAGDWLVEYTPDDHAIVASSVFEKTYRILTDCPDQ